jgi:hypothetical protein
LVVERRVGKEEEVRGRRREDGGEKKEGRMPSVT